MIALSQRPDRLPVLGAILAGGASRRFGSAKALASVGGATLLRRVSDAMGRVVTHPVVITGHPEILADTDLPARADLVPGCGPLGGIHAALRWADELGLPGALCVACDLPFLSPALLGAVAARGLESGARVVVPESRSPTGVEPLCAWYATGAIPPVEAALRSGDGALTRLVEDLQAERIALDEVSVYGNPGTIFLNVNTPAAWREAERLARGEAHDGER